MHQDYPDITDKLGRPLWWDERGVPRYLPFEPHLCNDIYCKQAVLFLISCQACGEEFVVAESYSDLDILTYPTLPDLFQRVKDKSLHYGDPPSYGCCAAGPTMNCEDLQVLEFWARKHKEYVGADGIVNDVAKYFEWKRFPELEIKLMDKPIPTGGMMP